MDTDNILSAIGATVSSAMAAVSWLWNIGFLQLLFTFLTGTFATYYVQSTLQNRAEKRRLEKNNFDLMRERIYGPLFSQLNQIKEKIEKRTLTTIQKERQAAKHDHLYFTVPEQQRKSIETFFQRVENYLTLADIVNGLAEQISTRTIRKELKLPLNQDKTVFYKLLAGSKCIQIMGLPEAIATGYTPKQILETNEKIKISTIDIVVGGYGYEKIDEVHAACEKALNEIQQYDVFQEKENERKAIIQEAEKLISDVTPHIIPSQNKKNNLLRRRTSTANLPT